MHSGRLYKIQLDVHPKLTHFLDDASRIIEEWRSKRIKLELPTIAELARIVDLPLSEDEKIPISVNRIQSLVNTETGVDFCTLQDVELLFRAGDSESFLDVLFFTASSAPPIMGTEDSFHSFWDKNVRDVLELIIPNGRSTRNSSLHTATGSLRPDYAFLLNKLCPFRGEEKAPGSTDNPKAELAKKLTWAYSPAPYVLGYYATGPDFTLAAISPTQRNCPAVHDIAYANLRLRRDRIKNIRRLINLSGLLQSLADLVQPADAEFEVLERDNCTVEIAGGHVIKVFTSPERVTHLRNIYSLLGSKNIPHVDSLVHHFDTTVVLSPRGIAEPPKTEKELLAALICVLEALEVLHKSPPIFHRDLRWPNVMRRLDDPQRWFIIDWDDAAIPPTTAQSHFNRRTHPPGVFTDGHGAEVDMWGVGELIRKCGTLDISLELKNFGKWLQGSIAPSAQEALGKIKDYQSSHF
ncbi:hypothetical protein BU17DRAFT_56879 [Hysterangium stoloniferum]|nr:hypothetical protein BU17DRAFT_56879 [Hysterangium stoloniferum]